MLFFESEEIRAFVELALSLAPEKFYQLPASSTGKYHPESSSGHSGLVRHTKQVFWIAKTLMDTRLPLLKGNRDVVLAGCLLHDIVKYAPDSESDYTAKNHGIKGKQFLENSPEIHEFLSVYRVLPDWYYQILDCIQAHNGIWSKEYQGTFSTEQSIVHAADYLASRKWCYFDQTKL